MLNTLQNINCKGKKKRKKRDTIAQRIQKLYFHLSFQFKGMKLQRERDTIEFISFPFRFGGFEVNWFILITSIRWSEVRDGGLEFFSRSVS